ncbi:PfkB domain protein [Desulfonatronospira thiodismutans ASO3-1]|uniref:PfkB domain protein n=2 Tax=Desulfonatronospira TaxID=488937 RepID=D6SMU0_9BACT|nr:carbohydrate kinase [Desulfonatronospira thiodismutans]EFI36001.1 PfkB domain protein [Desulfonatronospira thiodismutans ASO3-1]
MHENAFDRVLVFGEVLFDIFPDQSRVIGGAPFNAARHLQGLGLDPFFVSRVGRDAPGEEVREQMQLWGMNRQGLQVDQDRPTGMVLVRFKGDEPYYEIKEEVAFDYIEQDQEQSSFEGRTLFYHGTLAARSSISASTLYALAQKKDQEVFCDINLRDPWWSRELVRDILSWCSYLKVNLDELEEVASILEIREEGLQARARMVQKVCGLKCLVLTMGGDGAMLFPGDREHLFAAAPKVSSFEDAVGAGDSFSAIFLMGLCRGWSWESILQRAVRIAAEVCSIKGAVPEEKDFYSRFARSVMHDGP